MHDYHRLHVRARMDEEMAGVAHTQAHPPVEAT